MKKPFIFYLFFSFLFIQHLKASDTTYRMRPLYITVIAGITSNSMFGSIMDHNAEFNRMFNIKNATQKNKIGWVFGVNFQPYLSKKLYIKTGIQFQHKQVNPEENGYMLYKDSIKSNYLSVPLLLGINQSLDKHGTIFMSFELGPTGDFTTYNGSHAGIDRAGFSSHFAILSLQAGVGLTIGLPEEGCLQLHYSYISNLTEAYKETLYYGGNPPLRDFSYKYRTQLITIGMQWPM